MDTEEKPKRKRGRPRKNPEVPQKRATRPRGRPRKSPPPEKQQLTEQHVMILLKNHLGDVSGIKVDWASVNRIHPNKYIYQIVVDKLSMKFLRKLEEIPLVEDVYFFSKVGSGVNGINLLFKVHIVFDVL
jgi:hypothetical protein